jgi:hypothetical protein
LEFVLGYLLGCQTEAIKSAEQGEKFQARHLEAGSELWGYG